MEISFPFFHLCELIAIIARLINNDIFQSSKRYFALI